jgi:hypothetical protein
MCYHDRRRYMVNNIEHVKNKPHNQIMTDLNLEKFDPASAKPHRIWLIIGTRGSGKSVLLKDLLYKTRGSFEYGLAMTATHSSAETLRQVFPPSLIYENGYDFDKASLLLSQAKENVKNGKDRAGLLLLDDVAFQDKVMKSDTMKELHLNGRHAKITLMSTTQYCLTVSPLLRANIDYVCVMADNVIANRKRLHQFFFGCFETFQQFDIVFKAVTKDYGCLVLDNTDKTGSLEKSVKWYKADPIPDERFRIMRNRYYFMDEETRKLLKKQKEQDGVEPELKRVAVAK